MSFGIKWLCIVSVQIPPQQENINKCSANRPSIMKVDRQSMAEPGQITSRVVLVVGFGGLLLLMGYAGLDGIQALEQIRMSNDSVREDFLARTRRLEQIRGDVYVSGTYVRDYL